MRRRVLILDRLGPDAYLDDRRPVLDPAIYETVVVTKRQHASGFEQLGSDRVVPVDSLTRTDLLVLARELYQQHPFTHVVALSEPQQLPAAWIRAAHGLAGMQAAQATLFRDKVAMKDRVAAAGIRTPAYELLQDAKHAVRFTARHGRSVIKPCSGTASQGTFIVDSHEDARAAASRALGGSQAYEIETFVPGAMYHCDSLRVDGMFVVQSISRYWQPTTAFGDGAVLASSMQPPDELGDAILRMNQEVLDALEFRTGVAHLEVFATSDGPVFCEVAARPGGGGIVPSVRAVHGVDLNVAAIRIQIGASPPAPDTTTHLAAGFALFHRRPGRVVAISSPGDLGGDLVAGSRVDVKVGDIGAPAANSVDSAAQLVVAARTHRAVEARLATVISSFRYEVVPVD